MLPSSQPILGLDTATHTASAALVMPDGQLLAEGTLDTSRRGDDLLVLLDDLCRRAGLSPSELGAVAVGGGPGSFTGLRIGMATAKGVAFAAGCPLWISSSLAAMAAEAAATVAAAVTVAAAATDAGDASDASDASDAPLILPLLDARRGEVYCGFHSAAAGTPALGPERVMAPEMLASAVAELRGAGSPPRRLWCCGDALEAHPEGLAPWAARWLSCARTPSGLWVARLALAGARHDDLTAGRPAYLRPAEAEVKYPDGVPGARRTSALTQAPPARAATSGD